MLRKAATEVGLRNLLARHHRADQIETVEQPECFGALVIKQNTSPN